MAIYAIEEVWHKLYTLSKDSNWGRVIAPNLAIIYNNLHATATEKANIL